MIQTAGFLHQEVVRLQVVVVEVLSLVDLLLLNVREEVADVAVGHEGFVFPGTHDLLVGNTLGTLLHGGQSFLEHLVG